jgi:integrase/recombinase XerD
MAATFGFELNRRPTARNTFVVMLRITQNRKHKRIKTTVEISNTKHFDSKAKPLKWVTTKEPNHKKLNDDLDIELQKAKSIYKDLSKSGLASVERVKTKLLASDTENVPESNSPSFLEYARERTEQLYQAGNIRTFKKFNGFCNKLEGFLTDKKGPEKVLHPNTIEVTFNIFRNIVNRAIKIEGLMKPEKNPFLAYSYAGVKTTREKLNETEIGLILGLSLPEGSLSWHCRNYFLFSFYCAGIRAGDLIQLRWNNITSEGRLIYEMGKNHKTKDIGMVSQAKEILSKYHREDSKGTDYIFPLLSNSAEYAKATNQAEKDTMPAELKEKLVNAVSSKNALINKELAKIAKLAGIEKRVSFHISRHSFAKVAKDRKIDNSSLQNLLAHSNIRQTEVYMGTFDNSVSDEALQSVFLNNNPKTELLALLGKMNPEDIAALLMAAKGQQAAK